LNVFIDRRTHMSKLEKLAAIVAILATAALAHDARACGVHRKQPNPIHVARLVFSPAQHSMFVRCIHEQPRAKQIECEATYAALYIPK
jgi:hypothetical protein